LKEQADSFNAVIMQLQDELRCKSGFVDELSEKASSLQEAVAEHVEKIIELKRKNNQLNNNLNYYKKQAAERIAVVQSPSLPLNEAVLKAVNDVIESRGRYKLMKRSNAASAVAKAIFHPSFVDGIVLPEVIKLSKTWLRKNVFTPSAILKQMDIRGGTLNYEGLTVLNDVETASEGVGRMGRVLPSPSSLQRVAQKLEKAGETLCPFELISTDFGEGIEFNYAKTTRLVIDAFGLSDIGKDRPMNISASIDAAKLTKSITHTSAGLKTTDVEGRDPFKNKRSFIYDENSLRDLQSCNTIFLKDIYFNERNQGIIQTI
jgi:FtsZ-binding cell division protein ZapB